LKAIIRSFIAIDLAPEVIGRIADLIGELKLRLQGLPLRWVPADNIHLTLKFLGEVSASNIQVIGSMMQAAADHFASFEMSVGGIGMFPDGKYPRVIWLGVEALPALFEIQRMLDHETAMLGYPAEAQPFAPHLTIGRVARGATGQESKKIGHLLAMETVGFLGVTAVEKVHLYRSDLKPAGPEYQIMFSAALIAPH